MKLSAGRESLLKPLQAVIGVVERRQTMPILANVLLVAKDGSLSITATDLEVELADLELTEIEGFCLPRIVGCDIAIACKRYRINQSVSKRQTGGRAVQVGNSVISRCPLQHRGTRLDAINAFAVLQ